MILINRFSVQLKVYYTFSFHYDFNPDVIRQHICSYAMWAWQLECLPTTEMPSSLSGEVIVCPAAMLLAKYFFFENLTHETPTCLYVCGVLHCAAL